VLAIEILMEAVVIACTVLEQQWRWLELPSLMATRLYIHLAPSELSQRIRAKVEPFDARIRALVEQVQSEASNT